MGNLLDGRGHLNHYIPYIHNCLRSAEATAQGVDMTLPDGFLDHRPVSASGKPLTGRFVCHDIQWTGTGEDLIGTFTITVRELLAAAESNLIWTDQDVQRGVRPECSQAPRQLSLANGYPNKDTYIFVEENADEIAEKLLHGRKAYLSPLVWNVRPGQFEGYRDDEKETFEVYSGKIFLPDSHHRHQGLLKAARLFKQNPREYPEFALEKQFKVDIYFLSKVDEGNFFFDKNTLTRQTAKSKAFDLTTEDALSLLAKGIVESSQALTHNVNRVTDRLTSKNPQVVTLSTLREMAKSLVPAGEVGESEIENLSAVVGGFYDQLAAIRPELGLQDAANRHLIRQRSLVDAAVMMHGYAALARDFIAELPKEGSATASKKWSRLLGRLSADKVYKWDEWEGDLFDKINPLWQRVGVVKPSNRGNLSQVNNGATRSAVSKVLRAVLSSQSTDLATLVL